jgi:hypothetical protein
MRMLPGLLIGFVYDSQVADSKTKGPENWLCFVKIRCRTRLRKVTKSVEF